MTVNVRFESYLMCARYFEDLYDFFQPCTAEDVVVCPINLIALLVKVVLGVIIARVVLLLLIG